MNSIHEFARPKLQPRSALNLRKAMLSAALLAACLSLGVAAHAQVVPSGDSGGLTISAGVTASGYDIGYGQRQLLGYTAFADIDTRRRIGLEAEVRMLEYHQQQNVHAETYAGGVRYHYSWSKFQLYAKGLAGIGEFNFPYNYAHGSYFIVTPGGGVDYRLTRRIRLRLADAEYQIWPQFTFGSMSTYGISTGIRVRVF
jgi:hypothetical protein